MKRMFLSLLSLAVTMSLFTACGPNQQSEEGTGQVTGISLSDTGVMVGGTAASTDPSDGVYISDDIVFYLEGQGIEYGEGDTDDGYPQAEADRHTVVNITQPGSYMITGSLSQGQIAVNLGEDAKDNPDAVVNIILNNADINCTVAPAIICYSAYECGDYNQDTATKDVDTSQAGFNITLADGSVNNIKGGHVAKIYKPGTTDKLHKYDAAIESLVSMNIYGKDGVLNLTADNEGIETKLHMTINGGTLNIKSADDALNAGEDGVSVITINDGTVLADSNEGAEGDGIDSNGWVVINGGTVNAFGNSDSMDSGLDSDMGVYINGGTVFATGNMYDEISAESRQNFAVFSFAQPVYDKSVVLKSLADDSLTLLRGSAKGNVMVYSSPQLTEGDYELYFADGYTGGGEVGVFTDITDITGETQLAHSGMAGGRPGMDRGGKERPDGQYMPAMPDGQMPADIKDFAPPEGFDENMRMPTPDGEFAPRPQNNSPFTSAPQGIPDSAAVPDGVSDTVFTIRKGANMFNAVSEFINRQQ